MTAIDTSTALPWPTAHRVRLAWQQARWGTRAALLVACLASGAVPRSVGATSATQFALACAGVMLAAAALVDAHDYRLPNRLLAAALVAAFSVPLLSLDSHLLGRALLGMFLGGGLMLLVHLSHGVGMGDVKMAAAVGASLGGVNGSPVLAVPIAIAIAAFAAATYGLLAHRQRLAIGPSLWFGWASVLALTPLGWL